MLSPNLSGIASRLEFSSLAGDSFGGHGSGLGETMHWMGGYLDSYLIFSQVKNGRGLGPRQDGRFMVSRC